MVTVERKVEHQLAHISADDVVELFAVTSACSWVADGRLLHGRWS